MHLENPRNGGLVRRSEIPSLASPNSHLSDSSTLGYRHVRLNGVFHNTEELFGVKNKCSHLLGILRTKGQHLQQSLTVGACSYMDSQRASGLESAAQRAAPR
jgi:hypothetical protein